MGERHQLHTAEQAIARLASLPGGPELLAATGHREDIALVGGAVRDLLLGHWPRELDVTVERDAGALAADLAASVSPSERPYGHLVEPILHERFGTASVRWGYGRIDIAQRRVESYPTPGALPDVRPAGTEEDLARRDFTINAIALPLAGPDRARLLAHDGALEDLAAGRMRVLHERSFIEDPTRLLRLARYAARLGFEIEPVTLALAHGAVAEGALSTVSPARVGAEVWLACSEQDPVAALAMLDRLGVLGALGLRALDPELASGAFALLPDDGRPEILALTLSMLGAERPRELMDAFEISADVRDRALFGITRARVLVEGLAESERPSQLRELLAVAPPEAVAIAGSLARGPAADRARRWLSDLRHVKLEIDGADLLAAGIAEGPELGARMARTLAMKLDGEIDPGRDAELRAALEESAR